MDSARNEAWFLDRSLAQHQVSLGNVKTVICNSKQTEESFHESLTTQTDRLLTQAQEAGTHR